jgi:hypothetical protein
MNESSSVYAVLEKVVKQFKRGNYRGAVELLRPLLKEKLSGRQELDVMGMLAGGYRFFLDFQAALPPAQRYLELAQERVRWCMPRRSRGSAWCMRGSRTSPQP